MKKLGLIMGVLGVIAIIIGELTFTNLKLVNAADSHAWTININGIRSFPWPMFIGFELIVLGLMTYTTAEAPKGKRFS